MRKFIFTVREDVCERNGKDPSASGLLAKMREYGTVEDADAEREMTDEELAIVRIIRSSKAKLEAQHALEIERKDAEIAAKNKLHEKTLEDINMILHR